MYPAPCDYFRASSLDEAVQLLGEHPEARLLAGLAGVGQILGITESRVCQIHTKSVLRLRAKLKALMER